MNEFEDLEGFQNPYELEYSMSKENENKEIPNIPNFENNTTSSQIINNITLNKIKNFENHDQNNNFQNYDQNINFENNDQINNFQNLEENNNFQNYDHNNDFENIISNNQLNKNFKRNKSNNDINPKNISTLNKKNDSMKKLDSGENCSTSVSVNNIRKLSSMNDYWAKRAKKNKIKMEQLEKEKNRKIYGEIYDKPKLNKNSIEIVKRLKQNTFRLLPEEEIEDQINYNVPIKTLQNNYNNKFYNNNTKLLSNKNIKINESKNNKKLKKNNCITNINKNKEIPQAPNPKKAVNKLVLKVPKNKSKSKNSLKNNFYLSSADIKGLEKIIKMRRDEEETKLRYLQEEQNNINLINYSNYQSIQTDINQKESDYIDNNIVTFNQKNQRSKSVLNNKKTKIIKVDENQTKNQLIEIRNQLSMVYDMNKRVLNHSYLDTSCPNLQNFNNKNDNISSNNEYDYYSKRLAENQKNFILKNNNFLSSSNKEYNNISSNQDKNNENSNNEIEKSIDVPELYEKNNKNIEEVKVNSNDNNNFSNRINNLSYMNFINQSKKNNNLYILNNQNQNEKGNNKNNEINFHSQQCEEYNYNITNSINQSNNNTNNNNDNNDSIYLKEYKYQIKKINNLKDKYNAKDAFTKQMLNEAIGIVNKHDEYTNKLLNKNTININKFIQDVDTETLNKYRSENNSKLQELKAKNFIKEKTNDLPIPLSKKIKMNDDVIEQIEKDAYQKINNNKVNNILDNEKQKMENDLDYYNKELKINQQKKEMLLKKMFGNGGDNYCVKKSDIKPISNSEYDFDYYRINPQKNIFNNKNRKENKKEEYNGYKENENTIDVLADFRFQRKHHFS